MTEPKKCAHSACSCIVPSGEKYCSARCESAADTIEIACTCGHPGCQGEVHMA